MDFTVSERAGVLIHAAHEFARGAGSDEPDPASRSCWNVWGEAGWLGLCIPEEHGGGGSGALDSALAFEALGRGGVDRGWLFAMGAHLFGCAMAIANHGSEEQRGEWLARLANGRATGALAFTEPSGGSDFAGCQTTLRMDGDELVLNGRKALVTNAAVADIFVVLAATPDTPSPFGFSIVLVPKDTAGLSTRPLDNPRGLANTAPAEIVLENCRVPSANILGRQGAGMGLLLDVMRWERSCILAGALGAMDRDLRNATAFLERRLGASASTQPQAVSHALAEIRARMEAARWLMLRSAWEVDNGNDALMFPAMSKFIVSETLAACTMQLRQLVAGAAWTGELDLADALDDACALLSASGTSHVQLNAIYSQMSRDG